MRVTRREFDALGFLLSGGEEGMEGRQVRRLSSLVPFWRKENELEDEEEEGREDEDEDEDEDEEGCPYIVLQTWLEDVLCVNEALYPPPPDPFVGLPPLERQHLNSMSLPLPLLPPDLSPSLHLHKPSAAAAASAAASGLPPSLPPSSSRKRRQLHPHPPLLPLVITALNHGTVLHDTSLASLPPSSSEFDPFLPPTGPALSPALPRSLPLRRVYIQACHDANIYLLGPMEGAHIAACTDSTIVLGAVSGTSPPSLPPSLPPPSSEYVFIILFI